MDPKFINEITVALGNLNNKDANEQKTAKANLEKASKSLGYASALLKISQRASLSDSNKFSIDALKNTLNFDITAINK